MPRSRSSELTFREVVFRLLFLAVFCSTIKWWSPVAMWVGGTVFKAAFKNVLTTPTAPAAPTQQPAEAR